MHIILLRTEKYSYKKNILILKVNTVLNMTLKNKKAVDDKKDLNDKVLF